MTEPEKGRARPTQTWQAQAGNSRAGEAKAGGVKGLVFNVQPFSVHDGPGIRTMVFLKGCPLKCRWCSNPESQSPRPEPALNVGRCLGLDKCRLCLGLCRGLRAGTGGFPVLVRAECEKCPALLGPDLNAAGFSGTTLAGTGPEGGGVFGLPPCAKACPSGALILYGRPMGAAEVLAAVGKDAVFQNRSGGGLTVTGGEPLSQGDFLIDLLSAAKRARVSAAMETSGHGPYEVLSQAAGRLDLLFYDLKSLDPEKHRDFTGTGPSRILENLEAVCRDHPGLPIVVRTPVVPGFNDDLGSAMAIGRFLRRIPRVSHESLPYHALGGQKYGYLGRSYPMGEAGLAEGELARFKLAVERARYPDAAAGDGLAHKTAEFEK